MIFAMMGGFSSIEVIESYAELVNIFEKGGVKEVSSQIISYGRVDMYFTVEQTNGVVKSGRYLFRFSSVNQYEGF